MSSTIRADRVPDAPLAPPGELGGIANVASSRYLLWLLIKRELSARYEGQLLGMVWSYVVPLTQFAMYFLLMGLVMGLHGSVSNFALRLWASFVFVSFFTRVLMFSTTTIVGNASLVTRMAVPRELFPISAVIVSLYELVPPFVILVGVDVFTSWHPDGEGMLAALLGFVILAVFASGLALLCSAINVLMRDFTSVVNVVVNLITYSVPMMYPFSLIESNFGSGWVQLYLLNPLTECVLLIQRGFWAGGTPDPQQTIATEFPVHLMERGLWMLLAAVVFLGVAQWVFSKMESRFPERL